MCGLKLVCRVIAILKTMTFPRPSGEFSGSLTVRAASLAVAAVAGVIVVAVTVAGSGDRSDLINDLHLVYGFISTIESVQYVERSFV